MDIVEVKNLSKSYGKIKAVSNVNFKVKNGEIFGFLGPNGAGKTTTLEMIEGLRSPDGGNIFIKGISVWPDSSKTQSFIGVQLQTTALYEELTVEETLSLFSALYGQSLSQKRLGELLEIVGLKERQRAFAGNLSGGQKQRLAVALALVNDPEILFLDEPTTGLDPQARRRLWDIIRELNQKGKTIVLTTHYMEEAEVLCGRVAIIDYGRIVALDSPSVLIKSLKTESRVTFKTDGTFSVEEFEKLPGVLRTSILASGPVLYTNNPPLTVAALLEKTKEKEHPLEDLHISGATLEDVFLNLTGRELRD